MGDFVVWEAFFYFTIQQKRREGSCRYFCVAFSVFILLLTHSFLVLTTLTVR